MSMISEILKTADAVNLEEINKSIPKFQTTVDILKNEVVQFIDSAFIKWKTLPKESKQLLDKATQIRNNLTDIKGNAETVLKRDIASNQTELLKKVEILDSLQSESIVLLHICEIHDKVNSFTKFLSCQYYSKAVECIKDAQSHLDDIPDLFDEKVNIKRSLLNLVFEKRQLLVQTLSNEFDDNLKLSGGNEDGNYQIEIRNDPDLFNKCLQASFEYLGVVEPLEELCEFLLEIFGKIVEKNVKVNVSEENGWKYLQISVSKNDPDYNKVFENVKLVVEFLRSNFLFQISNETTTLNYIGNKLGEKLSELIVTKCLEKTIPTTSEGLEKYKIVISDTENLEKYLQEAEIFPKDMSTSILSYANNVDVLFINKKCQIYVEEAEKIMRKDLHDMVEVGTPYNPENLYSINFLQCSVSKSAVELLEFCERILHQTLKSSEVAAGRLFFTVQNIFGKYAHSVPEIHKKFLQTIPQQVALFYNNCRYIAHKLTSWNKNYNNLKALVKSDILFEAEIINLEKVADTIFNDFVKGQIKQVQEISKGAALDGQSLESLDGITEKCLRQCLRQCELLKTVWHKVLDYCVYNKYIGLILDAVCDCFITPVLKYEDISANGATNLVELFKILFNRGPKLFTDPKEINLYVPNWYKLNELNFVLNSSLVDINNRWADGLGPLALQFKPAELRQLIRALFQNTDRRDALLARIN